MTLFEEAERAAIKEQREDDMLKVRERVKAERQRESHFVPFAVQQPAERTQLRAKLLEAQDQLRKDHIQVEMEMQLVQELLDWVDKNPEASLSELDAKKMECARIVTPTATRLRTEEFRHIFTANHRAKQALWKRLYETREALQTETLINECYQKDSQAIWMLIQDREWRLTCETGTTTEELEAAVKEFDMQIYPRMTNIMLTMASRGMKQAKDREIFGVYHTKLCVLYDSMGLSKPETPTTSEAEIATAEQCMNARPTLPPSASAFYGF